MEDHAQKWPNHVVLVRHGESERNIHKEIAEAQGELVYGGDIRDVDVSLTERGRAQAVATGQALAKTYRFDRVFVSPYVRTRQTADIVNQRVHSFLGTITREYSQRSVLVICHAVIVLLFRKLIERLSDAELL